MPAINTRPDKRSYYLDIARVISTRSTCLRKHWGSVIVKNDVIVSTGYNGAPRGCTNCSDIGTCWRATNNVPRGTRYEACRANGCHSEQNAIMAAGRDGTLGSTLYICGFDVETGAPVHHPDSCQMCKRAIINAGIEEVVFADPEAPDNGARTVKVSDWITEGAAEPRLDVGY